MLALTKLCTDLVILKQSVNGKDFYINLKSLKTVDVKVVVSHALHEVLSHLLNGDEVFQFDKRKPLYFVLHLYHLMLCLCYAYAMISDTPDQITTLIASTTNPRKISTLLQSICSLRGILCKLYSSHKVFLFN